MKGVMALSMRKEKVERGLADSKELYGMRYYRMREKNIHGKIY
ncbi:hypothetical protein [Virgibacillus proomii]|nr:hypothetical protein [Virgibacillus proomii]